MLEHAGGGHGGRGDDGESDGVDGVVAGCEKTRAKFIFGPCAGPADGASSETRPGRGVARDLRGEGAVLAA
jgi:hypothetical protein